MGTMRRAVGLLGLALLCSGGLAEPGFAGGPVDEQPDLRIRKSSDIGDIGGDIYNTDGSQLSFTSGLFEGEKQTWLVTIQNDGDIANKFRVLGGGGIAEFSVKFKASGQNVTNAVRSGSFKTSSLNPGAETTLKLKVIGKAGAADIPEFDVNVLATPAKDPSHHDLVRAVVDND